MKKGLLSILASALLVVGCQNYDDQFNSIENSINALNQQIDGLSAVSSQLASLSSTVQSLSTTVSSLPSSSEIATQISDGLAGIIEDVADLEAAVAAADSSEAVNAIQEDIDAQEEVLAELLANSSVFNGPVVINSVATLNAFHSMGSSLAIVNGDVTFTVSTEMDIVKVQEVADEMLTITQDLSYTSSDKAIAEVKFNNLSGVQSLTMTQAGGYTFPELVSATVVTLGTLFDSTVTMVDFRKLATVTSIKSGTNDHSVEFDKATEIHLTALQRYAGTTALNPLTIEGDEGGVIAITALDDVDTDGDQSDLHIKITGPASMTISNITDGSIHLVDVATASVTGHAGTLTVGEGVQTLTVVDGVIVSVSAASDLETASIDLKLDDDEDLTTATKAYAGASLDFTDLTDLETLTVTGDLVDLTISGNDNLTTLVVNATMDDLTINDSDDLTSVTVTGSKIHDIAITENGDLASLVLDHTTNLTSDAATAPKAASLNVTNNVKLTSLTYSADLVDDLTVTGNDDLETVDFTGLAKIGSTTADVNITDNNFTASLAKDNAQATAAADSGAYTSTSGIATLKTYLIAAAAAPGTSGVIAFFDVIEASEIQSTVGGDYTSSDSVTVTQTDADNIGAVVYVTQDAADTAAAPQTKSWYIASTGSAANGSTEVINNTLYVAGDTNEGIAIDYPVSDDAYFKYATTVGNTDTLDNFITYFNTNADKDNFDLTISAIGGYGKTYLVTYTDTDGTSGAVSNVTVAGTTDDNKLLITYGTETALTAALTNGDDDIDLAEDIAGAIDGMASYVATQGGVSGYAYIVVNPVEQASVADKTPVRKWSLPSSITISRTAAFNTRFSGNATNGETSFTLSIGTGQVRYEGFIVTAKNMSAGTSRTVTLESGATSVVTGGLDIGGLGGFWGTESELSTSSFYNEGDIDKVSTTTVDSQIGGYVRSYADSSAFSSGADGEDTDRTGWL
ncbi:hypothetical protein OAP80_04920 [Flavobacteriaceae bacterium]|nr:hypothetical protein [Flavobacteriaceae bacterium]